MHNTYTRLPYNGLCLVEKVKEKWKPKKTKGQILIPMYKPLETEKCGKCGKIIAEPKELIDFWETQEKYHDWCL